MESVFIGTSYKCGKVDLTTSRGRTSLTPNELNIELSCFFPFRFDLESSLERKVISYFYIRSCLIAYGFITFGAETRERIPLGNSENLDLNQLRIRVACLICLSLGPRSMELFEKPLWGWGKCCK